MKQQRPRSARCRLARRWPWVVIALVLASLVLADRAGLLLVRQTDDLGRYHGVQVEIAHVVSGHTIAVNVRDPINRRPVTHVRLLGINAPLPAGRDRPAQPLADEAIELVEREVHGRVVTLRLESQRTRDTFGRLLAHVELPGGGTLNEALLEAGLAEVDERWPHAMLTRYAQVQQQARHRGLGIWSE